MTMSVLVWLEAWYLARCDGSWEHDHGIKIDTLDNPGWRVSIDLRHTPMAGATMSPYEKDLSDDDWIFCKVEDGRFIGHGDPRKLPVPLFENERIALDIDEPADLQALIERGRGTLAYATLEEMRIVERLNSLQKDVPQRHGGTALS